MWHQLALAVAYSYVLMIDDFIQYSRIVGCRRQCSLVMTNMVCLKIIISQQCLARLMISINLSITEEQENKFSCFKQTRNDAFIVCEDFSISFLAVMMISVCIHLRKSSMNERREKEEKTRGNEKA